MSAARTLLLVDGDAARCRALTEQLRLIEGVEIEIASDVATLRRVLDERNVDVLLLEQSLPGVDTLALIRELRELDFDVPVILLTATADEAHAEMADVLERPFKLNLLLGRIDHHLSQLAELDNAQLTVGPYRFRPIDKLLIDEAACRTVRLTEKEAQILQYLAKAGDQPTGRELLLNTVWGYNSSVTTHTLETHVYRLRQKIEADPARAEILVSEPGGYRLVS